MVKTPIDDEFSPQSPWLDLVNSEQWDGFGALTDHLNDSAWIRGFLSYWPGITKRHLTSGAKKEFSRLRELLREVVERVAQAKPLKREHLNRLNAELKAPGFHQLCATAGQPRIRLQGVRENWRWIRAQIVLSFAESYIETPQRIKVCKNALCRWAFVDTTKSNIRCWCNDRRCGNRARVRRSRAANRRAKM